MGNHAFNFAGLYIHVPFCESICPYCDFYSIVSPPETYEAYTGAIAVEADLRSKTNYGNYEYDTIFLGGGTPSVLNEFQLSRMFKSLRRNFKITSDAEITIECNPSSLTENKLRAYRDIGLNRISLGIQSFNSLHLKLLGRLHREREAIESIDLARKAGFHNLSIDLIYGHSTQTLPEWLHDLETARQISPEHISAYNLIIEPGTPYAEMYSKGILLPPPDDIQARMYHAIPTALNPGNYKRYEISNFAKVGYECRHNLKYWRNEPYLGLGPAAVSCDGRARSKNAPDLKKYLNALSEEQMPECEIETLDREKQIEERVMMRLRLADGLDLKELARDYEYNLLKAKQKTIITLSQNEFLKLSGDRLMLTDKSLFISNEIILKLI